MSYRASRVSATCRVSASAAWSLAQAVAAPLEWSQALLLILPVLLVATIPLSIAGWGTRETAMVLAFGYAGLPESDGLIVSVLFGIAMFAKSVGTSSIKSCSPFTNASHLGWFSSTM